MPRRRSRFAAPSRGARTSGRRTREPQRRCGGRGSSPATRSADRRRRTPVPAAPPPYAAPTGLHLWERVARPRSGQGTLDNGGAAHRGLRIEAVEVAVVARPLHVVVQAASREHGLHELQVDRGAHGHRRLTVPQPGHEWMKVYPLVPRMHAVYPVQVAQGFENLFRVLVRFRRRSSQHREHGEDRGALPQPLHAQRRRPHRHVRKVPFKEGFVHRDMASGLNRGDGVGDERVNEVHHEHRPALLDEQLHDLRAELEVPCSPGTHATLPCAHASMAWGFSMGRTPGAWPSESRTSPLRILAGPIVNTSVTPLRTIACMDRTHWTGWLSCSARSAGMSSTRSTTSPVRFDIHRHRSGASATHATRRLNSSTAPAMAGLCHGPETASGAVRISSRTLARPVRSPETAIWVGLVYAAMATRPCLRASATARATSASSAQVTSIPPGCREA